jgi:hypothetical protein
LQYNSVTGKWENVDRTGLNLSELGDVSIVSPSNGQVLVYNSTTSKWENSSAGFVPYVGAVTTVDLGAQGLRAGYVRFNTSVVSVPNEQGLMYWDGDDETIAVILNGYIMKVGEDQFYPVKNQTGSSIAKGTAVRFAGTVGASGRLLIAPFIADGSVSSSFFMGVTAEAIADGADGKVLYFGRIRGINTNSFNEGDVLYASTTVAGGFQTAVPVAPNNIVQVAAVITKSINQGVIFIRPSFGSNINQDEGVKIVSPTTGQLLQLQANGLWENKTTAQVLGGTSSQFVKGDGTLDSNTYQVTSEKGQPNGYASLDSNGKVPLVQINDALIGNVNFQGLWNAATNTPTLANPPASGTKGHYYIVSTAGTFASISFEVGDWIISDGTAWGKVDNTDAVSSVFGRTGNVVASNGDYTTAQVTESGNLYYTDGRARGALSFLAGSGAYNSTTGVITIPTNNNQITNGAGYITSAALGGYVTLDTTQTITGQKTISRTASIFNGTKQSILIDGSGGESSVTINSGTNNYAYQTFAQGGAAKFEIGIVGTSNNGSFYINRNIQSGETGSSIYIKKADGFVGINNITPTFQLDVTGNGRYNQNNTNVGNATGIRLEQVGSGDIAISYLLSGVREWLMGVDNSDSDSFKISNITGSSDFNNTGLCITTDGNVGIGVNTTVGKLDINTGANRNIVISNDSTDTGYNIVSLNGTRTKGSYAGIAGGGTGDNNLYLNTGSSVVIQTGASFTERMSITSGGNVLIGTGSANSKLQVAGSFATPHTTKSANYTLDATDYTVGFDCASNRTATLPDATTCAGRIYVIYQYNTNIGLRYVTIDGNGSQTINGLTTVNLQYQDDFSSVMIQSNGSNWVVIASALYAAPV